MGMGYGANYADVISKEDVIKLAGKPAEEFFAFFDGREDGDDLLNYFAQECEHDYDEFGEELEEGEATKVRELYTKMCDTFMKNTGVGVSLGHHDQDNHGDRYDDVNGWFLYVYNAYTLTPEAKKLVDVGVKLDRKFFVTYG